MGTGGLLRQVAPGSTNGRGQDSQAGRRFLAVAGRAERLPIVQFVPKQNGIASVRNDVINDGAGGRAAFGVTARKNRRRVAGSLSAERIPRAEVGGAFGPAGRVAAFERRTTAEILVAAVYFAVTARDADRTRRPGTIAHGFGPPVNPLTGDRRIGGKQVPLVVPLGCPCFGAISGSLGNYDLRIC